MLMMIEEISAGAERNDERREMTAQREKRRRKSDVGGLAHKFKGGRRQNANAGGGGPVVS